MCSWIYTSTLPGIAGNVLVIGMAVDANVLIFERIREELLAGETGPCWRLMPDIPRLGDLIPDSNVTTLIAAPFLFVPGTGPVKGFALTLSIGTVTFTAIFAGYKIDL